MWNEQIQVKGWKFGVHVKKRLKMARVALRQETGIKRENDE